MKEIHACKDKEIRLELIHRIHDAVFLLINCASVAFAKAKEKILLGALNVFTKKEFDDSLKELLIKAVKGMPPEKINHIIRPVIENFESEKRKLLFSTLSYSDLLPQSGFYPQWFYKDSNDHMQYWPEGTNVLQEEPLFSGSNEDRKTQAIQQKIIEFQHKYLFFKNIEELTITEAFAMIDHILTYESETSEQAAKRAEDNQSSSFEIDDITISGVTSLEQLPIQSKKDDLSYENAFFPIPNPQSEFVQQADQSLENADMRFTFLPLPLDSHQNLYVAAFQFLQPWIQDWLKNSGEEIIGHLNDPEKTELSEQEKKSKERIQSLFIFGSNLGEGDLSSTMGYIKDFPSGVKKRNKKEDINNFITYLLHTIKKDCKKLKIPLPNNWPRIPRSIGGFASVELNVLQKKETYQREPPPSFVYFIEFNEDPSRNIPSGGDHLASKTLGNHT